VNNEVKIGENELILDDEKMDLDLTQKVERFHLKIELK
jgi:hypothetical protein